jgi:hypothetical protein
LKTLDGYLDRIEEGKWGVILVEEIQQEWLIPVSELPEGSDIRTWFDLVIEQNIITSIRINHEKTVSQKNNVENMVSKLRAKSKGSKYSRK